MLIHYFTLLKIAESLQKLKGSKIIEVYSQDKDSSVLTFYNGSEIFNLKYSGLANFECIFLLNSAKKKANAINLLQNIYGETLINIETFENNRILKFEFSYSHIYFLFFGKSKNNLIYTNKKDIILFALNDNKSLQGTKFEVPSIGLKNFFELPKETEIIKALSNCEINLGKYYSKEFLLRNNIIPTQSIAEFSEAEISKIYADAKEFKNSILKNDTFYILENNDNKILFSLIALHDYSKIRYESSDLNYLIHRTYSIRLSQHKFNSLYTRLFQISKNNLDRSLKRLNDSKNIEKVKNLSNQYKNYGELLISTMLPNQNGKDEIEVIDYEGNTVIVPLDKKLNIIENANKYFNKYKDLRRKIEMSDNQQQDFELRYIEANEIFDELQKISNLKDLNLHLKKYNHFYKKFMETKDKEISEKFRKFEIDSGWTVYVGKNSENNDELTFRFAKPQDYWFHIRGASGSHTVLKGNQNITPPKDIIKKAASIAAYYSSQRNAKYVPVAFTQRKYVRKPKGANPGAVSVSKEEVVMVEPGLPKGEPTE